MLKDYTKVPIKRSGGHPVPSPRALPCVAISLLMSLPLQSPPSAIESSFSTLEDIAPLSRAGKEVVVLWPQLRCSLLSPAEMLRDIIREYTDVYPEIIERACFVLEKVRRQP